MVDKKPLVNPCGHTLCQSCRRRISNQKAECPECRKAFDFALESVNVFLN